MNLKEYNKQIHESSTSFWIQSFISHVFGIDYINIKDVSFFIKTPSFTLRRNHALERSSPHPYFLHIEDVDINFTVAWNDEKIIYSKCSRL